MDNSRKKPATLSQRHVLVAEGIGEVFHYLRLATEIDNGGPTMVYGYDATSQLTLMTEAGVAQNSYAYDLNGNTSYAYAANGIPSSTNYGSVGSDNQVTVENGWTYSYDNEGNVTGKTSANFSWSYSYDNANHLLSAVETETFTAGTSSYSVDVTAAYYTYDVFGNMIAENVTQGGDSSTTKFVYDLNHNMLAQLDGSNTVEQLYIRGDQQNQLLAQVNVYGLGESNWVNNVNWFLQDHLQSVRAITDSSGQVPTVSGQPETFNYDAYGNLLSPSTGLGNFGYAGMQLDAATGMYWTANRVYDPTIGLWYTQDPMGFAAGDSNLYRYVGNGPTNHTDPSGLQPGTFQKTPNEVQRAVNEIFRDRTPGIINGSGVQPPPVKIAVNDMKTQVGGRNSGEIEGSNVDGLGLNNAKSGVNSNGDGLQKAIDAITGVKLPAGTTINSTDKKADVRWGPVAGEQGVIEVTARPWILVTVNTPRGIERWKVFAGDDVTEKFKK